MKAASCTLAAGTGTQLLGVPLQVQPASTLQVAPQPSPPLVSPSSQLSPGSSSLLPQLITFSSTAASRVPSRARSCALPAAVATTSKRPSASGTATLAFELVYTVPKRCWVTSSVYWLAPTVSVAVTVSCTSGAGVCEESTMLVALALTCSAVT